MSSSADPAPRRAHPDPLVMTPAEKVIAEWEARHDVAARGSRPSFVSVQDHLAASRCRERCDEAARPRPAERSSRR